MPGSDDDIEVRVILRDELSGPADRVTVSINEMGDAADETAGSMDDLSQAQDRNAESNDRNARSVRANSQLRDEQGRFIRRVTIDVDRHTQSTSRQTRSMGSLTQSIQKTMKSFKSFNKILSVFGILLKASMAANAISGIAALGAAAMAAIAALSQLSGVVLALPSLLSGAALGAVATKMAFGGMKEAAAAFAEGDWEAFGKATKDMGPEALATANAFGEIAEAMKPIKKLVQERVWDGLGDVISDLGETYVPMLSDALELTADGMNNVFKATTAWASAPGTIEKINNILAHGSLMAEQFGHAFNGALRGMVGIMDAGSETGLRMSEDIAYGMNRLGDIIEQNRDRIKDFIGRAYDGFLRVGGVLVDFAKGLFNIFRVGTSMGEEFGLGIEGLARKFKDWTQSAEGQTKITEFFEKAKPVIESVKNLIGVLATEFAKLAMGDNAGLADMIDSFAEMVPNIASAIENARGLAPALMDIASAILQIVGEGEGLTPMSVLLGATVAPVELLADAFTALPEPIQQVIGYIVLFAIATKQAAATAIGAWILQTSIAVSLTELWGVYMLILRTNVMAASKAFLMFFVSNPIGWIILAVIALVAIFVVLWNKCEGFRNLVKAIGQWFVDVWNNTLFPIIMKVWEWMKDAWDKVYEVVSGVVGAVINWFKDNWDKIKLVVWVVIQAAILYFKAWFATVKFVVMLIWTIIKTAFNIIKTIVMGVVSGIMAYWKFMWGIMTDVVWPIVQTIITVFKGIWEVIKSVVGLIVEIFKLAFQIIRLIVKVAIFIIIQIVKFMWPIIKGIIDLIVAWFKFGWNLVVTVVSAVVGAIVVAWNWCWDMIKTGINFFVNLFKTIFNFLAPYVQTVVDFIVNIWNVSFNFISGIVSGVINFVMGIIGAIVGFVQGVMDNVSSAWNVSFEFVKGIVTGAIDFIRGIIEGIVGFVQPALDKIKSIWESVWGGIRDFVMGIIDKITGAIDGIKNLVSNISSGIGKVADMIPGLYTGGTVTVGMKAMVGELGPEAFVSNSGKVSMIGQNGPEVRRFPTAGYVVPNHVLAGHRDSSVPNRVMDKLRDGASNGGFETGTARKSSAQSSDTYMADSGGGASVQVIIQGDVNRAVQIEEAVREGIRKADRERRERG